MWDRTLNKGTYGYMKKYGRRVLLISSILFFLSLTMFWVAYYTTGTRKNYFSIISAVGILPAAKFFVFFIMAFRFKPLVLSEFERLRQGSCRQLYDLLYTSQSLNININACASCENQLIIYSKDKKLDKKAAVLVLKQDMEKELGIHTVDIMIFDELAPYLSELYKINSENLQIENYLLRMSL